MRVEGALTIKAPRQGAHKYTLLWSLSFWWCFRCVCTVIMSKILQNEPRVTVKGQHGANFGHARAKDPEISVCCLCVRHLRQGLTPWPVNLMATKHTHSHSCTQKKMNSQANRQANAHKLVHMSAHKLTEASLFFHASQNLGPLSR